jgi:hypothetical protein
LPAERYPLAGVLVGGGEFARQAAERDEEQVTAWKEETWPVIKGRRRTWAPGWSSKTNQARA